MTSSRGGRASQAGFRWSFVLWLRSERRRSGARVVFCVHRGSPSVSWCCVGDFLPARCGLGCYLFGGVVVDLEENAFCRFARDRVLGVRSDVRAFGEDFGVLSCGEEFFWSGSARILCHERELFEKLCARE